MSRDWQCTDVIKVRYMRMNSLNGGMALKRLYGGGGSKSLNIGDESVGLAEVLVEEVEDVYLS